MNSLDYLDAWYSEMLYTDKALYTLKVLDKNSISLSLSLSCHFILHPLFTAFLHTTLLQWEQEKHHSTYIGMLFRLTAVSCQEQLQQCCR